MRLLDKLRENFTNKLIDPVQKDLEETDWGSIDVVIKVDPESIVLLGIVIIVVALAIISYKKFI